jgi:hypothetical protein
MSWFVMISLIIDHSSIIPFIVIRKLKSRNDVNLNQQSSYLSCENKNNEQKQRAYYDQMQSRCCSFNLLYFELHIQQKQCW